MNTFHNHTIEIQNLPDFETVDWRPISIKYKKVMVLNLLFVNVIFLLLIVSPIYIFYDAFLDYQLYWYCPIVIVILGGTIFLNLLAFKRKKYAFREHDAMYRSGILSDMIEIVPYNRLQHVVVKQGWLSRSFGLATVKMYTAASGGHVSIPGIVYEDAERIKHLLLDKINAIDLKEQDTIDERIVVKEIENEEDAK